MTGAPERADDHFVIRERVVDVAVDWRSPLGEHAVLSPRSQSFQCLSRINQPPRFHIGFRLRERLVEGRTLGVIEPVARVHLK